MEQPEVPIQSYGRTVSQDYALHYIKRIIVLNNRITVNKVQSLASPIPSAFIANIASDSGRHGES